MPLFLTRTSIWFFRVSAGEEGPCPGGWAEYTYESEHPVASPILGANSSKSMPTSSLACSTSWEKGAGGTCVSGTTVACGDAGAASWSDSKSPKGGISSALPGESKIG